MSTKSLTGGGWNYRLIISSDGPDNYYAVHEVYYNSKGKGTAWSENPVYAGGSSPSEVYSDLCLMQKAFHQKPFIIKKIRGKEVLVEVEVNKVTGKIK